MSLMAIFQQRWTFGKIRRRKVLESQLARLRCGETGLLGNNDKNRLSVSFVSASESDQLCLDFIHVRNSSLVLLLPVP